MILYWLCENVILCLIKIGYVCFFARSTCVDRLSTGSNFVNVNLLVLMITMLFSESDWSLFSWRLHARDYHIVGKWKNPLIICFWEKSWYIVLSYLKYCLIILCSFHDLLFFFTGQYHFLRTGLSINWIFKRINPKPQNPMIRFCVSGLSVPNTFGHHLLLPSSWPSPPWSTDYVILSRRLLLCARDRLSAVVEVALQLYLSPWCVLEYALHPFQHYAVNMLFSGTHPDIFFCRPCGCRCPLQICW